MCSRENRRFWKCLTGKDEIGKVSEAGHADEDEVIKQIKNLELDISYCKEFFLLLRP